MTAENFGCLCTGEEGKDMWYKNTNFHRIRPGFVCQGGGKPGVSVYGQFFDDENFKLKHEEEGTLSMANSGKHTNNSQFFITLGQQKALDNKHVVFGMVVRGMGVVKQIEKQGGEQGANCVISNAGQ